MSQGLNIENQSIKLFKENYLLSTSMKQSIRICLSWVTQSKSGDGYLWDESVFSALTSLNAYWCVIICSYQKVSSQCPLTIWWPHDWGRVVRLLRNLWASSPLLHRTTPHIFCLFKFVSLCFPSLSPWTGPMPSVIHYILMSPNCCSLADCKINLHILTAAFQAINDRN